MSFILSRGLQISRRQTYTPLGIQVALFSKFISKSRAKRLPLTTKKVKKGYYKGNGCRKEGHINSKGKFIMDPSRCTELMVPDLSNFTLKAYVGVGAKRNVL